MSYDEVAGLLERVTGQPVLSDQTIQQLVVAKAVEVSRQWQNECQADTAAPPLPAVRPQVDWVVYLPNADKYRRLTRRPPKGQKVLYERALMASQRPCHSW